MSFFCIDKPKFGDMLGLKEGDPLESFAEKVSLQYGDAEVSFYNIKVAAASGIRMRWHSHKYYELHFWSKGNATYHFPDGEVEVKAGQMLIIPPDIDHIPIGHYNEGSFTVISMSVDHIGGDQKFYQAFVDALNKNAFKAVDFSFADIRTFEYTELYRSVLGVLKLKQVAACFVERLFTLLLSNNNPQIVSGKASAVLIDTLVNRDGTTLEEIAAATNYSKRHITRLIKKTYGMSLSQLRRSRIKGNPDED